MDVVLRHPQWRCCSFSIMQVGFQFVVCTATTYNQIAIVTIKLSPAWATKNHNRINLRSLIYL
jgi:hypothetical protein